MNAIVYSLFGDQGIYATKADLSPVRDGCVLVRTYAAGLNPCDVKFLYGDKVPACLHWLVRVILSVFNAGVGIDFSGNVIESHDEKFQPGDAVFGTCTPTHGSLREVICVNPKTISLAPVSIPMTESAALPLVSLTAYQVLTHARFAQATGTENRHHFLVIGASGGAGHVAVQMAKCLARQHGTLSRTHVTGICSSRNRDFVLSLGADHVCTYDNHKVSLKDQLESAMSNFGSFTLVFDGVTSNDTRDKNAYTELINGLCEVLPTYITLGGSPFEWILAHLKRFFGVDLFAEYYGTPNRKLFWVRFLHTSKELAQIAKFVDAGWLHVRVGTVKHGLDETGVREAFAIQKSRRSVGKIVVEINI